MSTQSRKKSVLCHTKAKNSIWVTSTWQCTFNLNVAWKDLQYCKHVLYIYKYSIDCSWDCYSALLLYIFLLFFSVIFKAQCHWYDELKLFKWRCLNLLNVNVWMSEWVSEWGIWSMKCFTLKKNSIMSSLKISLLASASVRGNKHAFNTSLDSVNDCMWFVYWLVTGTSFINGIYI